jgi:tetratricopeptide (TPR) repeat protein
MTAPLANQLFPGLVTGGRTARQIDNHYHVQSIANSQRQLVDYQAALFEQQHQAAIENLRALENIGSEQRESNFLLSQLIYETARISDGLDDVSHVLRKGFATVADLMIQQRHKLDEIAEVLRQPFGTQAIELLAEAERALDSGMRRTDRDQQEDWNDATRLLDEVLKNPIGSRNYVAWFHLGWLRWKHSKAIPDAEQAFYHAARLSADKADDFHTLGLRYLAYMQYEQRKYVPAYDSIHKVLRVTPNDHDALYDAARYAAKTGRDIEAIQLLEKCIELRASTIVVMFSDEDFVG